MWGKWVGGWNAKATSQKCQKKDVEMSECKGYSEKYPKGEARELLEELLEYMVTRGH